MAKLTDKAILALKPLSARYEVWDDARKGFGVRVSPGGGRSFVWVYHFQGKPRRLTFGVYPRMSLADAGVALAKAKQLLERGQDPGARAVAERKAVRDAETVAELIDDYLTRYARPRKRSAAEDERILRKDVLPAWGSRKVGAITRRDVVALLNAIVERGAPIQANRTLAIVRRMFRFAIGQAMIEISPCAMVEAPSAENQRDRVLSDDEIRALWQALDAAPMEANAAQILRMMLVTGQRKAEIAGLHIDEIDLARNVWTLPGRRAKNRREHMVPLSPTALRLLDEALPNDRGFVFFSRLTGEPYRGQSIDHATRYLFEPRPASTKPRKRAGAPKAKAPPLAGVMAAFTPHDLRRTVATRMRELGIRRDDIRAVLNHTEADILGRHYDRYDALAEKRQALELWGRRLDEIIAVDPEPDIGRLRA